MSESMLSNGVYLLQHSYEYGEDLEYTETKILGIFSTELEAMKAIEAYKLLPGFSDYKDSFYVSHYKLDEKQWLEGFISFDDHSNS